MPTFLIVEECAEWRRYHWRVEAENAEDAEEKLGAGEAMLDDSYQQGTHIADLDFPEREIVVTKEAR